MCFCSCYSLSLYTLVLFELSVRVFAVVYSSFSCLCSQFPWVYTEWRRCDTGVTVSAEKLSNERESHKRKSNNKQARVVVVESMDRHQTADPLLYFGYIQHVYCDYMDIMHV